MKTQMKCLLLLPLLSFTVTVFAQVLPDSTTKKIDSLFKQWDNYSSPGCAIGIVRNDSLIYAKGYGMANLEYGIRITPETVFDMASVSKQFTAYCIILLANQGKLALDDNIHKYLTWFPDVKATITIRNLLNHTSGIRDHLTLFSIQGKDFDDAITTKKGLDILSKQEDLNFKPGEKYLYSNSNFLLLAAIIQSASGKTLQQYADSAIFKPLGMKNSHFCEDYTEIQHNRAASYNQKDSLHFANSISTFSNPGPSSLFSTIDDMSKWVRFLYTTTPDNKNDIATLTKRGRLNSGREISYAAGISVDSVYGWKMYDHDGSWAGYRTYISCFPDLKTGFLVFSNLGDIDPSDQANKLFSLFITDISGNKKTPSNVTDSSKDIVADALHLKQYMGDYLSDDDGIRFRFQIENQKVYWQHYGKSDLLIPEREGTFLRFSDTTVKFVFEQTPAKEKIVNEYWPGNNRLLSKYVADTSQSNKKFEDYVGTYYSPEIDYKYRIIMKDNQAFITNNNNDSLKITLLGSDHLFIEATGVGLNMQRSTKNKITGFEMNAGRVLHLQFTKVSLPAGARME